MKRTPGLSNLNRTIKGRESSCPTTSRKFRVFWFQNLLTRAGKHHTTQDRSEINWKTFTIPGKKIRYSSLGASFSPAGHLLLQQSVHSHLFKHIYGLKHEYLDSSDKQLSAEELFVVFQIRRGKYSSLEGCDKQVPEDSGQALNNPEWHHIKNEIVHYWFFDECKGIVFVI